jgi:hypothetical protein
VKASNFPPPGNVALFYFHEVLVTSKCVLRKARGNGSSKKILDQNFRSMESFDEVELKLGAFMVYKK